MGCCLLLDDNVALEARNMLKDALFYLRSKNQQEAINKICFAIELLTPERTFGR